MTKGKQFLIFAVISIVAICSVAAIVKGCNV